MSLKVTFTAIAGILMCAQPPAVDADALRLAQTSGTEKAPAATEKPLGRSEGRAVTVKGTIAAIDKDKGTVTLEGPTGRTRHPRGRGITAEARGGRGRRSRRRHLHGGGGVPGEEGGRRAAPGASGAGEPGELEARRRRRRAPSAGRVTRDRDDHRDRQEGPHRHDQGAGGQHGDRQGEGPEEPRPRSRSATWSRSLTCRHWPCRSTNPRRNRPRGAGRRRNRRRALDAASSGSSRRPWQGRLPTLMTRVRESARGVISSLVARTAAPGRLGRQGPVPARALDR